MSHKKEGRGAFFLTKISLPKAKRNQVESKKVGFSKPQFHSPKRKRAGNSQSEPKFPQSFP
jgi:hypothetical protein